MNWTDKITALTTQTDDSPELKKGEIKNILLDQFSKILPDFNFISYKNSNYKFGRVRGFRDYKVLENLNIIFGLKDKNFACSISSNLNQSYANSNSYNTGLINPHVDLIVLKKGTGVISIDEAYYFHNGRVGTTTKVVEQIVKDHRDFGIPFLERQFNRLQESKIINTGLDYINGLTIDKKLLKTEIQNSLTQAGQLTPTIRHQVFSELKTKLFAIPDQAKEDRQKIDKAAFELLELYYDSE